MSVNDQVKFPLFSADVGRRIAFIREKQGLTLEKLGEGRASTAQSWEQGKMPRREKWSGIAERLGLSEVFIFHGRPETNGDYAFVAKWRNEIEGAEQVMNVVQEPPAEYLGRLNRKQFAGENSMGESESASMLDPRFQPRAEPTPEMCVKYFSEYVQRAAKQPGGVGYVWVKLQKEFPPGDFESDPPPS